MDQQPKIPTLKDAQKPQVKIKGMGAGLTLFDRLKQFKKKDLAFILAGLGTLFMAPLAEHFMMAPENGDMSAGFRGPGGGSGSNLFGSGSSPYENGNNSIAQGGAIGGSGDIITPLNVRDPSALVMGPGGTQQPPAGSAAPAVAPPTAPAEKTDYRDALAGAASRAASAAVKKAPLPVPKIALGGSGGLRGLGAASGGSSSGSGSLGPINSGNLGQAGTGGGGLNLVRSNPNFRGAAGPRGNSPTGLDGTKKAGANAGDAFSRTGSALGGLNQAASEQIPTGGQGFGGGGQGGAGANDKPGGGAGAAGSKSVGESLAFIEAKERMMENLKLEFEKRKLKDPELLLYGIRNDSLKAMAAEATKMLTKSALGLFADAAGGKKTIQCGTGSVLPLSTAENNPCSAEREDKCYRSCGTDCYIYQAIKGGVGVECTVKSDKGTTAPSKTDTAAANAEKDRVAGKVTVPAGAAQGSVDDICLQLASTAFTTDEALVTAQGKKGDARDEAQIKRLTDQQTELGAGRVSIGNLIAAQNALSGPRPVNTTVKCKGDGSIKPTTVPDDKSVNEHIIAMRKAIGGEDGAGGVVKDLKGALGDSKTDPSDKSLKAAGGVVDGIAAEYKATEELLNQARAALAKNPALTLDKFNPGEVQNRIGTYDVAWKDSTKLGENLGKIMESLKPAVDGLVAAAGGDGGSVKAVVDASLAFDKSLDRAKEVKIKKADGTDGTDTVLKPDDVTKAKKLRSTAPEGGAKEESGTPGASKDATAFVTGAKKIAEDAKTEKTQLGEVDQKMTGASVTEADASLIKTPLTARFPNNIAKVIKEQGSILVGIGNQSDMSSKAGGAPAAGAPVKN